MRRIAATDPNTIVVVNPDAPVELPWSDALPAALIVWFQGEEGDAALGSVLTGAADPDGNFKRMSRSSRCN